MIAGHTTSHPLFWCIFPPSIQWHQGKRNAAAPEGPAGNAAKVKTNFKILAFASALVGADTGEEEAGAADEEEEGEDHASPPSSSEPRRRSARTHRGQQSAEKCVG